MVNFERRRSGTKERRCKKMKIAGVNLFVISLSSLLSLCFYF